MNTLSSQVSLAGPATASEHDARLINARHHEVNPGDIAVGVIIGRTAEFFDFFVYAIAAVLVFPQLIFPNTDPLTATLYSFAIFALAFVTRPLGTLTFLQIDRRFGRGPRLLASLFLLGCATVAIAFLPGYAAVGGTSVIILAVFRALQGFAWGGTWDGLSSLLALHAPAQRRGWYAMIPQLGAFLGLLVASALFAYFARNLPPEEFLSWGWRYPFFVAFAVNVVALFARLRMLSTPEYTQLFTTRELKASPALVTLRTEGSNILLGAFVPLAGFALLHLMTVFPLSWSVLHHLADPTRFLLIELACAALGLFAAMVSGPLADRFGRRAVLGVSAGAIALFSGLAPQLLSAGLTAQAGFMAIGFVLLGLSFGQSSGAVATRFAPTTRYTASALTADLAWLIGAGFAPLVALLLASHFGLLASGLYLLSGALCTLIALSLAKPARE